MNRQAILIANAVSYGIDKKNVPAAVVNSIIDDFVSRMDNLGDYSFTVKQIVNQTLDNATKEIRKTIQASSKCDLLLIYYFGHAVRPPDSEKENEYNLYLVFKDSDWHDLPSMLDFNDVAKWLKAYAPDKVVIIMDCCYAGVVRNKLHVMEDQKRRYFLMASVTNKGKAEVDYSNDRPIGTFSKYLLDGFFNPAARVSLSQDVTFESAFEFAAKKTKEKTKQEPVSIGDLADEVFFRQVLKPAISPMVRSSVAKKSSYYKLFILGSCLLEKEYQDITELYTALNVRQVKQFLTPVKINSTTIEYRFMSEEAFSWYVELCQIIGMVESKGAIRLTALGKVMVRRNGADYNKELYNAVKAVWKHHGVELEQLEHVIGRRMRNNGIPTIEGIYSEMYIANKLYMGKELFRILLNLTAYVGALRYSNEHTFFLPNVWEVYEKDEDYWEMG